MTDHVTGRVDLKANGKTYHLWLGISVLADIQSKHGLDALDRLEKPAGASNNWMPDLRIVSDLFLGALQREHADEANKYLVDDIIEQNQGALPSLMAGSSPKENKEKKMGNANGPAGAA
ncbi:MAG: hypothetical protein U5K75_06240 [Ahrensia sp.]|nr:hypothetical protein [Ahrensia sp.]